MSTCSRCGTGTSGGRRVHQQGSFEPSAIPQTKAAPQRLQVLMGWFAGREWVSKMTVLYPYVISPQKIQREAPIMPTASAACL
jgi:hypothetical protein